MFQRIIAVNNKKPESGNWVKRAYNFVFSPKKKNVLKKPKLDLSPYNSVSDLRQHFSVSKGHQEFFQLESSDHSFGKALNTVRHIDSIAKFILGLKRVLENPSISLEAIQKIRFKFSDVQMNHQKTELYFYQWDTSPQLISAIKKQLQKYNGCVCNFLYVLGQAEYKLIQNKSDLESIDRSLQRYEQKKIQDSYHAMSQERDRLISQSEAGLNHLAEVCQKELDVIQKQYDDDISQLHQETAQKKAAIDQEVQSAIEKLRQIAAQPVHRIVFKGQEVDIKNAQVLVEKTLIKGLDDSHGIWIELLISENRVIFGKAYSNMIGPEQEIIIPPSNIVGMQNPFTKRVTPQMSQSIYWDFDYKSHHKDFFLRFTGDTQFEEGESMIDQPVVSREGVYLLSLEELKNIDRYIEGRLQFNPIQFNTLPFNGQLVPINQPIRVLVPRQIITQGRSDPSKEISFEINVSNKGGVIYARIFSNISGSERCLVVYPKSIFGIPNPIRKKSDIPPNIREKTHWKISFDQQKGFEITYTEQS